MVKITHLNHAPIIEAIIDIRLRLPDDIDLGKYYETLKKELITTYKKFSTGTLATSSLKIKNGKPEIIKEEHEGIHGIRFKSKSEKVVVQFKKDGFTFSRLHPYTDWKDISEEAKRLWKLYCTTFMPKSVVRISVQYINRIDIPEHAELEDYFTSSPKLPRTLPQALRRFFSTLCVKEEDFCIDITQTLVSAKKEDSTGYIIDIEVFKEGTEDIDTKTIWMFLNKMRILKNKVFFNLIKEKAVVLLK